MDVESMVNASLREDDDDDEDDEEPTSISAKRPAEDYFSVRHDGETNHPSGGPHWMLSCLHRWYRLHDLGRAALRYGPVFPMLSPLALDAALSTPGTRIA